MASLLPNLLLAIVGLQALAAATPDPLGRADQSKPVVIAPRPATAVPAAQAAPSATIKTPSDPVVLRTERETLPPPVAFKNSTEGCACPPGEVAPKATKPKKKRKPKTTVAAKQKTVEEGGDTGQSSSIKHAPASPRVVFVINNEVIDNRVLLMDQPCTGFARKEADKRLTLLGNKGLPEPVTPFMAQVPFLGEPLKACWFVDPLTGSFTVVHEDGLTREFPSELIDKVEH